MVILENEKLLQTLRTRQGLQEIFQPHFDNNRTVIIRAYDNSSDRNSTRHREIVEKATRFLSEYAETFKSVPPLGIYPGFEVYHYDKIIIDENKDIELVVNIDPKFD